MVSLRPSTRWRASRLPSSSERTRRVSCTTIRPTKLKVTGIDVFSLGDFADGDDRQEIVLRDAAAGVYKRLVLKENRIVGTVLYGETADGAWFNDLKKKAVDISEMRETLIFGQAYQGGVAAGPYGGRCSIAR